MAGCTTCGGGKKVSTARNTKSVATRRGQTTKPSGGVGRGKLVPMTKGYAGSGTAKSGMVSHAQVGHSKGVGTTPVMNSIGASRGRRGH